MFSRRTFLKALSGATGTFLGLWTYGRYIEPGRITVTVLRIAVPGLPPAFRGFRIVHLSDLHLGPWVYRLWLERWITTTLQLRPDVVVVTGDWVTGMAGVQALEASVPLLARLRAPEGVFTILGNHDYWADAERVRRVLNRVGIRELRNTSWVFQRGEARLALAGVDDVWSGMPRWDLAVAGIPEGVPALVLVHEPDAVERTLATKRFFLQLSGHSHGGQVHIPGRGPLALPYLGRQYPQGLYRFPDMFLYTSRGLGMSVVPLRIFCPPEIALVILAPG